MFRKIRSHGNPKSHVKYTPTGPTSQVSQKMFPPGNFRHHKRFGGVVFRTTINDLNPNSGFSSKRIESSAPFWWCVWIQRTTGTETNPPHLGGRKQGQCPSQAVSREDQIPIAGHRIEKASFSSRAAEFQIPPPRSYESDLLSQKERNSWLQFGTIYRVFFCKGKNKPRKSTWNWKSPNWRGKPIWTKPLIFFGGVSC